MDAALEGITLVGGAGVLIITDQLRPAHTFAVHAHVLARGTRVEVVAVTLFPFMTAALRGRTRVHRAGFAIITIDAPLADALPLLADIIGRAHALVVARRYVEEGLTSIDGVTRVVRAGILIVTLGRIDALALSPIAGVGQRASVAIIAIGSVEGVLTSRVGLAPVVCADVAVIAVELARSETGLVDADARRGAYVLVLTVLRVRIVDAALEGFARVRRADVPVIALGGDQAHARALLAEVSLGAGVTVLTLPFLIGVVAALLSATEILGAGVVVVAQDGGAALARAALTDVSRRTHIAVVARARVVIVCAASER